MNKSGDHGMGHTHTHTSSLPGEHRENRIAYIGLVYTVISLSIIGLGLIITLWKWG